MEARLQPVVAMETLRKSSRGSQHRFLFSRNPGSGVRGGVGDDEGRAGQGRPPTVDDGHLPLPGLFTGGGEPVLKPFSESDIERLMSQARDEIVALLEAEGPLARREIKVRLEAQVTDDQMFGCLMYLSVEGRIERSTGLCYSATGAVGFAEAL
jgi:hypothetical protein